MLTSPGGGTGPAAAAAGLPARRGPVSGATPPRLTASRGRGASAAWAWAGLPAHAAAARAAAAGCAAAAVRRPARAARARGSWPAKGEGRRAGVDEPLPVLFEDDWVLVANKPSGLLSQAYERGEDSLCARARVHLSRGGGSSEPRAHLLHRLDRDVSGACAFAKTSAAASFLGEQFREREVLKEYIGIVRRWRLGGVQELRHTMRTDEEGVAREVDSDEDEADARVATLECRPLCEGPSGVAAVLVRLMTGRRHQIRFQLSAVDSPLLGDPRYGHPRSDGSRKWIRRPALHAWRLRFAHPVEPHAPCETTAPLPADMRELLSAVQLRPEEVAARAAAESFA